MFGYPKRYIACAIIDAIHSGELETADYTETPIFHLKVCYIVCYACYMTCY
jgi:ATP-dependent phosphoenolpyruvate carboxykinase